jgi:hypothetical protein
MRGDLSIFKNAKAIQSTWAGVNHLLKGKFPPGVPIARMVDQDLSANMVEYLVYWVLDAPPWIPASSPVPSSTYFARSLYPRTTCSGAARTS